MSMVKTSVSVPGELLARARRAGINVSEVTRTALERSLHEAELEQHVDAYRDAFADWEESGEAAAWDATAADGIDDAR
jgi:post-segregation antitoxin (ccd killing protein)